RRVAERSLPQEMPWRRKAMFVAPFDCFHMDEAPAYVHQLMSEEALEKTGYFNVGEVRHWRQAYRSLGGSQRISVEMGLAAVFSTQLWHQLFIDESLAEVPVTVMPAARRTRAAATAGAP